MYTPHCLELAYSSNYFSLAKISIFRLFKMVVNQSAAELNRCLRMRSVNQVEFTEKYVCPVRWGCRIHWLLLCRGVKAHPQPTCVLYMTLNNLMVMFQLCWSFGESRVPPHCCHSQVHSDPEWYHLIGSYLWVK